jgi:hypothetical protein
VVVSVGATVLYMRKRGRRLMIAAEEAYAEPAGPGYEAHGEGNVDLGAAR